MSVRSTTSADVAAIAALEPSWTAPELASTLASKGAVSWVYAEDCVLGHVISSRADDTGEIVLISVNPEYRRRGLGGILLRTVHAHWLAHEVVEGWLEVRADNTAAIALYQQNGWSTFGVRRRYYRDGTDALRMRWRAGGT